MAGSVSLRVASLRVVGWRRWRGAGGPLEPPPPLLAEGGPGLLSEGGTPLLAERAYV